MANTSDLQITPFGGANVENAELSIKSLYLHHLSGGPNKNQEDIIRGPVDGVARFGTTTVNNWAIYDGDSVDATLVARAQGLHIYAGNWHNSFTVVFEAGRLKGSTLQVMGASVEKDGSWAIVGGTGDLSMARGVLKRKLYRVTNGGDILLLTIHAFCTLEDFPAFDTSVLWGGINAGSVRKNIEKPWRLESVTIRAGNIIDSFEFTYIGQDGMQRTEGRWGDGGGSGSTNTIKLAPREYMTGLSGTYRSEFDQMVLKSLTFATNLKTYGPFGETAGTRFTADIPKNSIVVGFHGRSGRFVNAIGVYTM